MSGAGQVAGSASSTFAKALASSVRSWVNAVSRLTLSIFKSRSGCEHGPEN